MTLFPLHLFFLLITITIFVYLLKKRINQIVISDPLPSIHYYLPKEKTEIDTVVALVKTGINIKNFSEFNTINNRFIVDANIWFEFNPTLVTPAVIEKFSFLKGDITKKSEPDKKMLGKNLIMNFDITVKFATSLDQHFFPFDDHRITLILINQFVTTNEIIYIADEQDFNISQDISLEEHTEKYKKTEIGYMASTISSSSTQTSQAIYNPVVLFSNDFAKPGIRKAILIIGPLFLTFYASILLLLIYDFVPQEEIVKIIPFSFSIVIGILGYRFVIESMSPQVGYSTISDLLFIYFLALSFIVYVITNVYILIYPIIIKSAELRYLDMMIRHAFILVLYVLTIYLVHYLFFTWRRGKHARI